MKFRIFFAATAMVAAGCRSNGDGGDATPTPTPLTYPRLIVANGGSSPGVKIWDNVDTLTVDTAASESLSWGGYQALSLALHADRLFVATGSNSSPVFIYDGASTLSSVSQKTAALPSSAFKTTPGDPAGRMYTDAQANLWILDSSEPRLFLNAGSVSAASTSQALFTHPNQQIFSLAYDATGNKLIGSQVSGSGVIVWNNPGARTGETNDPDFTLETGVNTPYDTMIAGDRLYIASVSTSGGPGYVFIWNGISAVTAAKAPDVTLTGASGLGALPSILVKNNTLIGTVRDFPVYKVNIYKNASAITADRAPDFEITNAAMSLPVRSYLAQDDRLYVMDTDGILIFDNATTAPTFVTEIKTGVSGPTDFLLLE